MTQVEVIQADQELLPCPFCESAASGIDVDEEDFGIARGFCQKCGACGPYLTLSADVATDTDRREAGRLWNSRLSSPSRPSGEVGGLIERLLAKRPRRLEEPATLVNPDGPEAADRIASLTTDLEQARHFLAEAAVAIGVCVAGFEKSNPTLGGMAAIQMLTEAQARYRAFLDKLKEEGR